MAENEFTRRTAFGGLAAGFIAMPQIASEKATGRNPLALAGEDYGLSAEASASANAAALQKAVNQAQIVQLPSSTTPIAFDKPIILPPNTRIVGRGSETRLVSTGNIAFICEAGDGSGGDIQAPWLEDFELFCAGSGIRYNRANGGFSDKSGQQALMRPRLDRVRIRRNETGNTGSVGIEFNKCFDGLIQQCVIEGFDKGYFSRGSDLIEISGRSRISLCNTLIDVRSVTNRPYRFGSGTRIIGNDLLAARRCYVYADDFDFLAEGNYFEHSIENSQLSDWAFDIIARNRVRFIGNRMELQATLFDGKSPLVPRFLKVESAPSNIFVWEDNGFDGLEFGSVQWNAGTGQRYWINGTQRSRILQRGTSGNAPLPLPFNSSDIPQELPWRFSPSLPGLRNESLGGSVLCVDNAFIIPYAKSDVHLSFQPTDTPINGAVDIWIKAKAPVTGKVITVYATNGGKYLASATQALTNTFSWYKIFSGISVNNLLPFVLNKDAAHAGEIHLGELVVTPSALGA